MALRRYFGKISPLTIDQLVGHNGELVIDEATDKVYIMDGVTPGGHEIANVQANLNLEYTNVVPAINSIYNLGAQNYEWGNLYLTGYVNPSLGINNWGNSVVNASLINANNIFTQTSIETRGNINTNLIFANSFIETNPTDYSGFTFQGYSGTTGLIHANVGNVLTLSLDANGVTSWTNFANGFNTVNGYTQFYNNLYVTGNNVTIPNFTTIGLLPSFNAANAKLTYVDNVNNYTQLMLQNKNSGSTASGDFVVTADNGTDSTHYIDLGINSSTFNDGGIDGPDDGYLLVEGGHLLVSTLTNNKDIIFATGGHSASNVVARFKSRELNVTGNIIPAANVTYSLGNVNYQWKDLYVSNNTIYIGGIPLSITNGLLYVGNSSAIGSTNGNVSLVATANSGTTKSWTFNNTGVVQLPTYTGFDYYPSTGLLTNEYWIAAPGGQVNLMSNDGNNYVWVDDGGAYIATNWNVSAKQWTFGTNGILSLPSDNYLETTNTDLKIGSQGSVYIRSNAATGGGTHTWSLANDGSTTFPDHKAVSITGNLTVGNLFVTGNSTVINTSSYTVSDNIIQLADQNPADILDLGFAAHRTVGGTLQHTGLVRDASANTWRLFSNITTQPGTTIDFTNAVYDSLQLGAISSPTITDLYSNAATQASNLGAIVGGTVTLANVKTTGGLYWANGVSALVSAYGNTQVSAYYVANTVATSNVQILNNGNIRLPTGATINESAGSGTITLSPNTTVNALAGVAIGGLGYLLSPNGTRNAVLNYNGVNGQMGVYILNTYGNQANAIVNGGANNYGNIGGTTSFFGNAFVSNIYSPNYLYPNGTSILSGISGTYGNTQVAAYLPTYTGTVMASYLTSPGGTDLTILPSTATGTRSYGHFVPQFSNTYNLGSGTLYWQNAWIGNITVSTGINWANGVSALGGGSSYGNTQVAAYLPTYNGISAASRSQVTTGIDFMYGGFPYMGWQLSGSDTLKLRVNIASSDYTNDVLAIDRQTRVISLYSTLNSNATANVGNVITTSGVFWANGVAYSSGSGTYGNTQVAAYLPTYSGNVNAGNINVTANVNAANINVTNNLTYGNVSTTGNVTAGYFITTGTGGNISGANYVNATNFVATANASAAYVNATTGVYSAQYYWSNGTVFSSGGSGTPSGGNTMIQFNDAGAFGGATYIQYNKTSGNLVSNSTTAATSTTTGALVVGGGMGVGGAIYSGGNIVVGSGANLLVGSGQGGFLFRTLVGGTSAAIYNLNLVPSAQNYSIATNGSSLNINTPTGGGIYSSINNSIITTVQSGTGSSSAATGQSLVVASGGLGVTGDSYISGNFGASGNMLAANHLYTNGQPYAGTYANSNVSAYLPTYTGNVGAGNLIGTSSNVTITSGANVWTFDNTGNLSLPNLSATYILSANTNGNININTVGTGSVNVSGNLTIGGINAGYAPNRPAFRVYGSNSFQWQGGNTIVAGSVDYNQGSYYNAITGIFTAPIAGLYHAYATLRVGTNNGMNQASIQKNSSNSGANVISFWETDTNTGTATHFSMTGYAKLAPGDTVRLQAVTGNINLDANDSWGVTYIG